MIFTYKSNSTVYKHCILPISFLLPLLPGLLELPLPSKVMSAKESHENVTISHLSLSPIPPVNESCVSRQKQQQNEVSRPKFKQGTVIDLHLNPI